MSRASSAIEILIAQRIEQGMRIAFPHPSVRRDAYAFLALSEKGGRSIRTILMETVFGVTLTCAFLFGDFPPFTFVRFGLAFLSGWATYQLVHSHVVGAQVAQREMDELIRSNESYWKPIAALVQLVVYEAGKLDGNFWPDHISRLIQTRK